MLLFFYYGYTISAKDVNNPEKNYNKIEETFHKKWVEKKYHFDW
jgi:hypothetical protein